MYGNLLESAVIYEQAKRHALNRGKVVCERSKGYLNAALEAYDRKHYQTVPCSGDILCERIGKRHKADCQGKVEPITVFWKKVQG